MPVAEPLIWQSEFMLRLAHERFVTPPWAMSATGLHAKPGYRSLNPNMRRFLGMSL